MPTAQQEYHGKVAQVKAKVTGERAKMAGAKSEAEEGLNRLGEVKVKWADFVVALAVTRSKHTDYVGSLGAAATHHKDKLAPAQGQVAAAQGETETAYQTLISDIRHPEILKFATLLGGLSKSVKTETGIIAKIGQNYDTMNAEADRRTKALDSLHNAAVGYEEKRLNPQEQIVGAVPGQYEEQMKGGTMAVEALDAYVAST